MIVFLSFVFMKNIFLSCFIVLIAQICVAQNDTSSTKYIVSHPTRVWIAGGGQALLWTGTFIALDKAWYASYPKSPFHLFNDWNEWEQMDKCGHLWTAYQISRASGELWDWTGVNEKQAILLGGASGVAFQGIIEILDGYSDKWGFSWGDMSMNIAGSATYVAQQLIWKKQRIQIKLGYYPFKYDERLKSRANSLFGATGIERILKDYNSQTYWISTNLDSFFPEVGFPKWLNIAVGYNARLMLGGTENKWEDKSGLITDRRDIPRYRRFVFSADIDLTRISTKNKVLKTVFSVFNSIKIPAPAISIDSKGRLNTYGMYF